MQSDRIIDNRDVRAEGDYYEDIVLNELKKYNPNAQANSTYIASAHTYTTNYTTVYSEYDFPDYGGIEVKYDLVSAKSNRLAVDTHTEGKISGISASTANFWIYFTPAKYYIIEKSKLAYLMKYEDAFRYRSLSGQLINGKVMHYPNFFNEYSKKIMDMYCIPIPAIELYSIDSGDIKDFNLEKIIETYEIKYK